MPDDNRPLLKKAEVAAIFRVSKNTVTGWVKDGKLDVIRTPGGHLRFREDRIRALLNGNQQ